MSKNHRTRPREIALPGTVLAQLEKPPSDCPTGDPLALAPRPVQAFLEEEIRDKAPSQTNF